MRPDRTGPDGFGLIGVISGIRRMGGVLRCLSVVVLVVVGKARRKDTKSRRKCCCEVLLSFHLLYLHEWFDLGRYLVLMLFLIVRVEYGNKNEGRFLRPFLENFRR